MLCRTIDKCWVGQEDEESAPDPIQLGTIVGTGLRRSAPERACVRACKRACVRAASGGPSAMQAACRVVPGGRSAGEQRAARVPGEESAQSVLPAVDQSQVRSGPPGLQVCGLLLSSAPGQVSRQPGIAEAQRPRGTGRRFAHGTRAEPVSDEVTSRQSDRPAGLDLGIAGRCPGTASAGAKGPKAQRRDEQEHAGRASPWRAPPTLVQAQVRALATWLGQARNSELAPSWCRVCSSPLLHLLVAAPFVPRGVEGVAWRGKA